MLRPTSDELTRLGSLPPHLALAAVAEARARLTTRGPEHAREMAESLPAEISQLAPEVQRELAELTLALASFGPTLPLDWPSTSPAVRALWLRALLAVDPASAATAPDDDLLHAIAGWSVDDVPAPLALLSRCCSSPHAHLAQIGIEWTVMAVRRIAIRPHRATELLLSARGHADADVRRVAVEALAEPWAIAQPDVRRAIEEGLADDARSVALATLRLARRLGQTDRLTVMVADEQAPETVRVAALAALGHCATAAHLASLLSFVRQDVPSRAAALRQAVTGMHRRGVFVRDEHLPALLEAFDHLESWDPAELARVTFTSRDALVELLCDLGVNDDRWVRRAPVLAHAEAERAPAVLAELLAGTTNVEVAVAALDAAARCPDFADENTLLRWLDALPEAALGALRIHGTERTAEVLAARLADPFALAPVRRRAIELAFGLAGDHRPLRAALDPRELPETTLSDARLGEASAVDPVLSLVADRPPLVQLEALSQRGDLRHLPWARRCFRQAVLDRLKYPLQRERRGPDQPTDIEAAVIRFGDRLRAAGRTFSPYGPSDGPELLRVFVLEWLAGAIRSAGDDRSRHVVTLLSMLRRVGIRDGHLRRVHRLWRNRDPQIQRAAAELLIDVDGMTSAGLELSLCTLAGADRTTAVRHGLRAIAAFGADWAEDFAIAGLDHPNMNVKKTAAEALAVVGTAACVPAVVRYLAGHDNPGLRAELLLALDQAAGASASAVLVDRLDTADRLDAADRRERANLLAALDGRLRVAEVVRLLRGTRPSGPVLRDAVLDGQLILRAGDANDLRDALHEGQARAPAEEEKPALAAFERLGFSAERAASVLDEARADRVLAERLRRAVRTRLPEWQSWASQHDDRLAAHLAVAATTEATDADALFACLARLVEPMEVQEALRVLGLYTTAKPALRHRALEALRRIPAHGGLLRLQLVHRLGGVLTVADVRRALDESEARADRRSALAGVLRHAFRVSAPVEATDGQHDGLWPDGDEDVAFARVAAGFHARSAGDRDALLGEMLRRRPLGVPLPKPTPKPPVESTADRLARASIEQLRAALGRPHERRAVAEHILDAPRRSLWPQVLDLWLDGQLDGVRTKHLARTLREWPTDPARAARAVRLLQHVPAHRVDRWFETWLSAWEAGAAWAPDALARLSVRHLASKLHDRLARGDEAALRLVIAGRVDGDPDRVWDALEELVPGGVTQLRRTTPEPTEEDPSADATTLEDWLALARDRRGTPAARAAGRLVSFGEDAVGPLITLCRHRDSQVRHVAFRSLRKVASMDAYLVTALEMLERETHRDLQRTLIRVLSHRGHLPAVKAFVQLLTSSDRPVRQAARDGLLTLGEAATPQLRKLHARARPDRAALLSEIIETLG